ncbi:MAG: peptide-methionine (R)-S-oxide reductase [Burkholderiaceae bacterium]
MTASTPRMPRQSASLTPEQFRVTQQAAPGRRFATRSTASKRLYVDIVSGEPLFTSLDSSTSGCGWPSFTRNQWLPGVMKRDASHRRPVRTEVRSAAHGDGHLGHVFDDGPRDRGGLRYRINSASLRASSRWTKLAEAGYAEFVPLFKPG